MLYVATKKARYALAGLAGGTLAAVVAYFLFNHVRQRVIVWQDPIAVYDKVGGGYQVAQGLFGISAGGWFGMGLGKGMPNIIPVVDKDFIFAAICEELGAIFAICMLLVCMSCYLMIVNVSMQMSKPFYKLIAMGTGCRVCVSGISDSRRNQQIYSYDRNYPSTGKLWRKLGNLYDSDVCHHPGTVYSQRRRR